MLAFRDIVPLSVESAAPIVTLVVDPETPSVPIFTVFVLPLTVAPFPILKVDAPTAEFPILTFSVEPDTAFDPIFTVFVFPETVAPVAKLYVEDAVFAEPILMVCAEDVDEYPRFIV